MFFSSKYYSLFYLLTILPFALRVSEMISGALFLFLTHEFKHFIFLIFEVCTCIFFL